MKTLLMAIDNSPVAEKVIALTIEQALAQQAQVTVLCRSCLFVVQSAD
ncbi:hypothetical protein E05_22390 [Plautia stali symbiont]|nr:hypothetical protein E05_22390 [Plautia stali symbiont]